MVEGGRDLDFPEEPLGAERGRKLRAQELEGDETFVLEIAGEVHRGHSAAAQLALDRVAAEQGSVELGELVGHGARPEGYVQS